MHAQAEHFRLYCARKGRAVRYKNLTLTVFADEALSSSDRSWWRGARYLVTLIYFAFSIIPGAGLKSKGRIYTAEKWRVSKCIYMCSHKSVPNQSDMTRSFRSTSRGVLLYFRSFLMLWLQI